MRKGCLAVIIVLLAAFVVGSLRKALSNPSGATSTPTYIGKGEPEPPVPTPDPGPSPQRSSSFAHLDFGRTYHTVKGAPACLTPELYTEFWGYFAKNDAGALDQMVQEGQCVLLKGDQAVEVTDKYFKTPQLNEVRVIGTRTKMVLQPSIAIREVAK